MNTRSSTKISVSTTGEKRRISSKAIFALIFYVIMPMIAIIIIIARYPELSAIRLMGILMRITPVGLMLILVSQYQVRYERGSLGRFILNEAYVALVVVWLLALLGGEPVIHQTWEEYRFSLHIWNYLVLIFVVTGLNVFYYALEYRAFRTSDEKNECPDALEDEIVEGTTKHKGVTIITVSSEY